MNSFRLSSGQWSKISETRPLCSNHDDGVTAAIIQCETCQSLCGDCDRFLHLSRKTRNHRRTVCKEEEDAIRVELHEGCGRAKLFWLLALADSRSLKAIIEFRDGNIADISSWSRCLMSTGAFLKVCLCRCSYEKLTKVTNNSKQICEDSNLIFLNLSLFCDLSFIV